MGESVKYKKHISPPRLILLAFVLFIAVGTLLLKLPISAAGESISWLDALFTATSAVCVNGLAVIDTGSSFSTFGQVVIMILMQIGGLGFMTLGVVIALLLGKKIRLRQQIVLQHTTQATSRRGLLQLSLYIFFISFIFELIATIILTIRWSADMGLAQASFYALFHSVSAFNNAGFALWSDSLSGYMSDPVINMTIMTLFIFGGLGYIVIVELFQKRSWKKFSLHTKIVLATSAALIVIGFVLLLVLESLNPETFQNLTWGERIAAALFQSTTPRSAGFNTIDIHSMLSASQLILIFLMFIGASSGGTGGGIKTNTFVVLILATINTFRGGGQIHVFQRKIANETVMRALAVVMSSLACVLFVALLLTITEGMLEEHFLEVLFEATSAFSTTGLSMGLTTELSPIGKVIVSITMFVGRLGPLTLAYALATKKKSNKVGYPEDHVLIG
ncbi:TrkH family potassium uptake protein [Alkalihalobacillus pseudalcaliphilus]|uniref:TrkH family potassium uptake protein n=1 Tax=Alkalihalobacillus pseudalcaliphilus TaxID=79884 RepID=UPI00064DAF74|nr:TrkH family potassium uptake protein [Alkalihalobacillus pseudalcaliphilus]KMK75146.1 Ktr system potassium transporter B [Alkalihalobacillus pseudalcaliphilus]